MSLLINAAKASWGPEGITLNFPFGLISFKGLSYRQYATLAKDYSSLLVAVPAECNIKKKTYTCNVVKAPNRPERDLSQFKVDSQYVLTLKWLSGRLEIGGIDFVASIPGPDMPPVCQLGVVREEELAWPVVFENFLRVFASYTTYWEGGLILHSAGVVIDGRVFLFCGQSGVGKTTLSRKAIEAGALVINDELNRLLPYGKRYLVHDVPFAGKYSTAQDESVNFSGYSLAGFLFLEQADELSCRPVNKAIAVTKLLAGASFINRDDNMTDNLFDILEKMVNETPAFVLKNRLADSFQDIIDTVRFQREKL